VFTTNLSAFWDDDGEVGCLLVSWERCHHDGGAREGYQEDATRRPPKAARSGIMLQWHWLMILFFRLTGGAEKLIGFHTPDKKPTYEQQLGETTVLI
jgi:hypothetical protein